MQEKAKLNKESTKIDFL